MHRGIAEGASADSFRPLTAIGEGLKKNTKRERLRGHSAQALCFPKHFLRRNQMFFAWRKPSGKIAALFSCLSWASHYFKGGFAPFNPYKPFEKGLSENFMFEMPYEISFSRISMKENMQKRGDLL